MTEMKHIKSEKTKGIARLTLARPKHNVLNCEMMKEMIEVLEKIPVEFRFIH